MATALMERNALELPEDRYFDLCDAAEMRNGERRAFEVDGRPVLLVRIGQQFLAVQNRCTHLDFPLDSGRQIGFEIMCRKHGARFDLRDGRAACGPAVKRLPVYPTHISEGRIRVGLPPLTHDPIWPA